MIIGRAAAKARLGKRRAEIDLQNQLAGAVRLIILREKCGTLFPPVARLQIKATR